MRTTIFLLLLTITYSGMAQEANNWYFGNNAGLTFNNNNVTALTGGQVSQSDNSSSISDKNGNLLFYTNGITVWNKNHQVMANGSGLVGNATAGQCALIVPVPCSEHKYLIFQVTEFASPGQLRYSVVDMSLNNGLGGVITTSKNVSLGSGWTEKLCAYYNPAGEFFWVLSHKWNSNQFVAFKLGASGIPTQSVISSVGSVHDCGQYSGAHDAMGQLTISPDGTRILNALTCQDKYELFRFDINSGLITDPININSDGDHAWGTAFSPDSKLIYFNSIFGNKVYQCDISTYSSSAIASSQHTVVTSGSFGYNFGYMELGPDNKLYIAKPGSNSLSVVHNPNAAGATCNFSLAGPYVGSSTHGLSRIAYNIAGTKLKISATATSICPGNSATLIATGLSNYQWNTNATTSTIAVSPSSSTVYSVTAGLECKSTAQMTINVHEPVQLHVSGPTVLCYGQSGTLQVSGAHSYTWSGGTTTPIIMFTATGNTLFSVIGTNTTTGCTASALHSLVVSECTGINDQKQQSVHLWPNPSNGSFNLLAPINKMTRLTVIDMLGRQVDFGIEQTESDTHRIKLSNPVAGIYTFIFSNELQTVRKQFVVSD